MTLSQNGNTLGWETDGSDVCYRGRSDRELPVRVTMTWLLDGKEMTPEEIKGKSGHLTIRWNYENLQKTSAVINGKAEEICVPFMAASAMVLNAEHCFNVTVKNGKVLSDGNRLIAAGIAFPGLTDSLGIRNADGLNITLPESVELSADVTDFETDSSVTVVSNPVFPELSEGKELSADDLTDQLRALSDGAISPGMPL